MSCFLIFSVLSLSVLGHEWDRDMGGGGGANWVVHHPSLALPDPARVVFRAYKRERVSRPLQAANAAIHLPVMTVSPS